MTWGGLKRNPLKDWNVPSSNYRHICYVRLNGCNVHIKWESQVHLIYDPPPTQPDPQKKKHKNSSLQKRLLKRKNGFKEILQSTLFSAENNFSLFTGHYVLSNLSFGPTFHKNWTGHNLLTIMGCQRGSMYAFASWTSHILFLKNKRIQDNTPYNTIKVSFISAARRQVSSRVFSLSGGSQ